MTWTLRLYDESDSEIGWATHDPHEFWVDSSHEFASLIESTFGHLDREQYATGEVNWEAQDGVLVPEMVDMFVPDDTPSQERLDSIGADIVFEGWADRYELTDE